LIQISVKQPLIWFIGCFGCFNHRSWFDSNDFNQFILCLGYLILDWLVCINVLWITSIIF